MSEWRDRSPSPTLARHLSELSASSPSSFLRSASAVSPAAKGAPNLVARAANARLAQIMALQAAIAGDGDEDFESASRFMMHRRAAPRGNGTAASPGFVDGVAASLLERSSNRSPLPALSRVSVEPTPAVHSTSTERPSLSIRTTLVPPSVKTLTPIPAIDVPVNGHRDRRFPTDVKHWKSREYDDSRETSDLRDELDMLQEENENLLERLRLVEEKYEEAEVRTRELEKQVAFFGEGASMEVRLLKRKEAALLQKEKQMRDAIQTKKNDKDEEVAALRQQVQAARDEAAAAAEQLREAESEAKALHSMTQRMILTEEEKEEVVFKRCWLARFWGLAVRYGIYPDIAASKHEHWSSLAPLPFEVVTSAGQIAKEEASRKGNEVSKERNKLVSDFNEITGKGNIESMLSVEKGLRELASLKVEDAVVLALAQHQRLNLLREYASDYKLGDLKFMEALELSKEEAEDVLFKQSWLVYFWGRAKQHGVEEEIAEERSQFWIDHLGQQPSLHDAIDVERGLIELKKLGIEHLLWEASRRDVDTN
ncbi:coiled-coil domain-containing protein SCD2-like [Ananas comosus]|uniref:Coiled-coil domain-containing protein SCD2-like n=1 Tax=Ananas comosus TaxID=4615 RepID=A0A6P5GM79_ANACO|nr:coiled-coil domain-containing protein SCD2-like [Ananas comosus]